MRVAGGGAGRPGGAASKGQDEVIPMAQEATLVREEGQGRSPPATGGAQDVRYGDDPTAAYEGGGGDDDNYYHQYAGYGDGEYEGFYYD